MSASAAEAALHAAVARRMRLYLAAMLARGADVNKDVTKKKSPLHVAVAGGNVEGVRLLRFAVALFVRAVQIWPQASYGLRFAPAA